jgi:transposase-like protein
MSLTSRRTVMARKRYKPEEIVAKLRQVDVLVSQGQNMVDAIRQIGVSEVTYYRWRQEFGGLKTGVGVASGSPPILAVTRSG